MPDGMVPIVQEFMRTYLDVVAKQKCDPMEKVRLGVRLCEGVPGVGRRPIR